MFAISISMERDVEVRLVLHSFSVKALVLVIRFR